MEGLVETYRGRRVFITGAYGFKASWCCCWLRKLGAIVEGYGRPPRTTPNHHDLLGLPRPVEVEDLLNFNLLMDRMDAFKPDLVIHFAAKAIVAKTFTEPRVTFDNNVMGAVNTLEATRKCGSVKGVVMIVTDKVYANREWRWAYRENDELGGLDPYSASKVCVEHVIECYRSQFFPNIATARAGNVIGGGDWAYKRLVPDIVRATVEGRPVEIHTPYATRPWQHVLEPLYGYLLLGQKLLSGDGGFNRAWNFGPDGEMTVLDVLRVAKSVWPKIEYVVKEEETHPSMVQLLKIDSTESRTKLGWRPRWDMEEAIERTIWWYRDFYEFGRTRTDIDISVYVGEKFEEDPRW